MVNRGWTGGARQRRAWTSTNASVRVSSSSLLLCLQLKQTLLSHALPPAIYVHTAPADASQLLRSGDETKARAAGRRTGCRREASCRGKCRDRLRSARTSDVGQGFSVNPKPCGAALCFVWHFVIHATSVSCGLQTQPFRNSLSPIFLLTHRQPALQLAL